MKNFKKFLSAILTGFIVLAFVSCEKNDNDTKCLIQSRTDYELVFVDDYGETDSLESFYSFSYDANGKLNWLDMDHSLFDDLDYILFFYDNNGKLDKIEEHYDSYISKTLFTYEDYKVTGEKWLIYDNENPNPMDVKEVYKLNNLGEIVKINHYQKYNEEWRLLLYQDNVWQNGNLVKSETYYHSSKYKQDPENFSTKPFYPFTGKFILKEKENIIDPQSINNNFVKWLTHEITYDDKKNPFFEPHYALGYTYLMGPLSNNTNNELSVTMFIHSSDIGPYRYTFSYEYNLFDYPTGSKVYLEKDNDSTLNQISNIVYDCD